MGAPRSAAEHSSHIVGVPGLGSECEPDLTDFAAWHPTMALDLGEMEFQLSSESVAFLDSIFMQDSTYLEMSNVTPQDANIPGVGDVHNEDAYSIPGVDPQTLDAALEAYFGLASLALPILYRDAFMSDLKSRVSSLACVCAVACRGCPFLQTTDKWSLQQTLARSFRENFLRARETSGNGQTIRLDDLEALALMVDFPYSQSANDSVQCQLGSLFLTHDSLVLMTLQYDIQTSAESAVPLSRAQDRKRLLFWHVYGLDAFRCVNHKTPSRIRDDDTAIFEQLHKDENKGYLDAVLGLAIMARRLTQVFCSPAVRRNGVKVKDIKKLYEELERWRDRFCASQLYVGERREESPAPSLIGESVSQGKGLLPLHQAIVTLLQHDCYMQLESYVVEHGIEEEESLEAILLQQRVQYETLQTAWKIANLAEWLQSQDVCREGTVYALTDLASHIVRNICVGTSFWLASQGKNRLNIHNWELNTTGSSQSSLRANGSNRPRLQAESFAGAATRLRNTAATAQCHEDTTEIIVRLDEHISSLRDMIENAGSR